MIKKFLKNIYFSLNNELKVIILNLFFFLSKINSKISFNNKIFCIQHSHKKIFFSIPKRIILFRKGLKFRLNHLKKKYFLHKIKFKKNDIIIDCGANIGEFFYCFNKKLKIGYYAFEPSPIVFTDLNLNIKSKNCYIYNLALNDKTKKKKFYVLDEEADSSLIKINNYTKIIFVNCITLDLILKKIKKKIKLLKIDAEGAEPEVLAGLNKFRNNIEYIVIEAGPERGIKLADTFKKSNKLLTSKNFKLIYENKMQFTYLFKNKNFE